MPRGPYRKLIVATAVIITMAHIAFVMVFLFLCQPVSHALNPPNEEPVNQPQIAKAWDPAVTGGTCLDGTHFYTSFSALTIVFDVTV